MDLTRLAQLGEFVGGIAVLFTLIYLAVQLRQGNRLQEGEALRTLLGEYNKTLGMIWDPGFTDVFRRATKDFDALSRHEQSRAHVWAEQLVRTAYAAATLDPNARNLYTGVIQVTLGTMIRAPGFRSWWRRYHVGYEQARPGFARTIEEAAEPFRDLYEICPWYEPTEEELRPAVD